MGDCRECTHHDVFWEGAGCLLLNNMEKCKFESKNRSVDTRPTDNGGEG